MSADQALDLLRRRHSGEMYACDACYRHEPCPERDLIRQYDRIWEALDTIASNNDIGCRHCHQMAEDAYAVIHPEETP